MKLKIILALLCAFVNVNAQRYQQMFPNRDNYFSIGAGYPYIGIELRHELIPSFFLEGQAFTDGGALWKEDKYNDWRCITFLKVFKLSSLHSEIRLGGGLAQSEEPPFNGQSIHIKTALHIACSYQIKRTFFLSWSATYPFSDLTNMYPGLLYSIAYRFKSYSREIGLY